MNLTRCIILSWCLPPPAYSTTTVSPATTQSRENGIGNAPLAFSVKSKTRRSLSYANKTFRCGYDIWRSKILIIIHPRCSTIFINLCEIDISHIFFPEPFAVITDRACKADQAWQEDRGSPKRGASSEGSYSGEVESVLSPDLCTSSEMGSLLSI